jgi:hypothetical protein
MEKTPENEEVSVDGSMEVVTPTWMGELEGNEIQRIMERFSEILYNQELGPLHGSCICYAMANMIVGILKQSVVHAKEPGALAGVVMTAEGISALMDDAAEYVHNKVPKNTMRLFREVEGNA